MIAKSIEAFLFYVDWINDWISSKVREHGPQYTAFAIFGLINFTLPFFMWGQGKFDATPLLYLRSFASFLCFVLLLRNSWPMKLRSFLPSYWYFTLWYCLSFLTSYLLLLNQGSIYWLMNLVLAIFLLVLLVDWISFIILLSLGLVVALIVDGFAEGPLYLILDSQNLYLAIYMYFFSILIGFIFSRNKEKIDIERLFAIEGLSASIAHEIRTPLSSLRMNAEVIRLNLPKLLEFYKNQKFSKEDYIDFDCIKKLETIPNDLEVTINNSFLIIDMLLNNIKVFNDFSVALRKFSIAECIHDALNAYPFRGNQQNFIFFDTHASFFFMGDDIMIRHVIYNLIKNSLYYINDVDNPKIEIFFRSTPRANLLHIKDNGSGVRESDLPHIFEPFYSKTKHGTGVGLSFCKMVMEKFNGSIMCESEFDHYTQFILSFPIIS